MLSWSTKRKFIYISIVAGLGFAVFIFLFVSILYKPATCTDGKLNQNEAGVDCGGVCARICENTSLDAVVHWQRAFPVVQGVYNLIAYVENPNLDSGARNVAYDFRVYNKNNILIAERTGTTFIPPRRAVPIFEPTVRTGDQIPVRVTFSFDFEPEWTVIRTAEPDLRISEQVIKDERTVPLITARITNDSQINISGFDVVVIVYDDENNARAASKTVVDGLLQNQSAVVNFAWPAPFGFAVSRIEIVPKVYPGINF